MAVAKFEAMIDSGEYSYVIGQRSVRRASGLAELGKDAGSVGREIPDIIGIRPDGKIDVFEVVSASQNNTAGIKDLLAKLKRINNSIPPAQQGDFELIYP